MNCGKGRLESLLVKRPWRNIYKINGKGSAVPGVTSKSKEWVQRKDRTADNPKEHEIN